MLTHILQTAVIKLVFRKLNNYAADVDSFSPNSQESSNCRQNVLRILTTFCFDMVDPEDNELGISCSGSSVPKNLFLQWSVTVMFIERVAFRSPTALRLVIGVPKQYCVLLFLIHYPRHSI